MKSADAEADADDDDDDDDDSTQCYPPLECGYIERGGEGRV